MDGESSRRDNPEITLHDKIASPCKLEFQYLKEITNNFSAERVLGGGGFGVVYKGKLPNGELMAVKKLKESMPGSQKQFENEVYHLMSLNHPNIVRCVGYCYETQNLCLKYDGKHIFAETADRLLCLEYMPNGSLDNYLTDESRGLDWHKRYNIISGICYGLHYIHKEWQVNTPIVHMDLKPANILLGDNMLPKIADFGLSRLLGEQQTRVCTTSRDGTPGYMAPEYIDRGIITPKSDIFSLGVIIIELITGYRNYPWPIATGTSYHDFVELVLKKWRKRLEAASCYASLETDYQQIRSCLEMGLSCLDTDPEKRPATKEIIERLIGWGSTNFHVGSDERLPTLQIKSDPREFLVINPRDLQFCLGLKKRSRCLVRLTNSTEEHVAFSFGVKRARNNYNIEPTSGFLCPRSTFTVLVTMEELHEFPSCNDEFLVQTIVVRGNILTSHHNTGDSFNMSSNVVHKEKLTVAYVPPAQSPTLLSDPQQLESFSDQETVDTLIRCICQDLGFSDGRPIAACIVYRCLLHLSFFLAIMSDPLAHLSPVDQALFHRFGWGPTRRVQIPIVHHAFEQHVLQQPDAIAVECPSGATITYAQLERKANRLARRLRAQGIRPGTRVCILAKRSIPLVVAILAVLKSGGQYVPLDAVTITDETLQFVLEDSCPRMVLTMHEFAPRIVNNVPIMILEDTIHEDEQTSASCDKVEDLSSPSDGIYCIYTSGTTGRPKGVDVKHLGAANVISGPPANVGMQPGMRVAQLLNIAFDMGAWEILGSLYNGCTLCMRGNSSKEWAALLKTVNIVISTPSIIARHNPEDYPNIKHVIVGGEPCSQSLADRWAEYTNFNNCCGPTEISICNTVQPHTSGYPLSIGKPIPNTNVYILSYDTNEPTALPIGEVGCMWVGGMGTGTSYLNLPERTAERWRKDPFVENGMMFNTGDLGRWRKDGQLDHMGRVDDQVKVKGFRVELDGVSTAMRRYDAVTNAVALLVDLELWGFVTPSTIDVDQVRKSTSAIQPYYTVPTRFLAVEDFPMTRNGKIDKRALISMAKELTGGSSTSTITEPSTPTPGHRAESSGESSTPSSDFLPTPRDETDENQFVFETATADVGQEVFPEALSDDVFETKMDFKADSLQGDVFKKLRIAWAT